MSTFSHAVSICAIAATCLIRPVGATELAVVGFDAPAIVVAEPVNPDVVDAPTTGGWLVRLRIPVSTFVSTEFRGTVDEYVVEFESPTQSLRVVDFWPKSEMTSEIEGNVTVESSQQRDQRFTLNVSAAYEPLLRGSAEGEFQAKSNVQERYQRKPPMQVLSSSGTIRRGYGVFFKFRPGPTSVLEGVREVAILAEVPQGWRADMLQVTMHATGSRGAGGRSERLGDARLWTTTHREGDQVAAAQTRRFVTQERSLRTLAASSREQVSQKALPSWWHKLGAALDVVEPRIPSDYLNQVIFGSRNVYRDNVATNRLPVDLRVAVLDYWDERDRLASLAFPQYQVARPAYPETLATK